MMTRKLTMTTLSLLLIAVLLSAALAGPWPLLVSVSAAPKNAVKVRRLQKPAIRRLEPGVPVAEQLAGANEHHYEIVLATGQFVTFQTAKQGLTLHVTLNDPKGETLFVGPIEAREQGTEVLYLVAQTTGLHTLIISPAFPKAPVGRYQLKSDELRVATDRDRQRFEAQQRMAEGDRLFERGSIESRRESLEKLSAVLEASRALGDRALEAEALNRIGRNYLWAKEDYKPAYKHLEQALELARAEHDITGQAEALRTIGMLKFGETKNDEAVTYLNQSADLLMGLGERWQLAATYGELGKAYWRLGDREKPDRYFAQALDRLREVGDPLTEAVTRTSLSVLHSGEGEYQAALDDLFPAIELFHESEYDYAEAVALNNVGRIYLNLGDPETAVKYFDRALKFATADKDLDYGAPMLTNKGIAYGMMGHKQGALVLLENALDLARQSKTARSESNTLSRIGRAYLEVGDYPKALENLNDRLRLTLKQRDLAGEAETRSTIGEVYAAMGEHQKALDELNRVLPVRREVSDRQGQAATLYVLSGVERDLGRFREALTHVREAVELIESLRAKVIGMDLRISYLAAYQSYYDLYIDLLMRLHQQDPAAGHAADALHASERARARGLLESLAEARADIREGVSRELLERERSLGRLINVKEEEKLLLTANKTDEIKDANFQVGVLIDQLKVVRARIRAASPRYAALTQPQPFDLKQIQAQLDDKTLLLVYSLGKERSFLFAVTPTALQTYVLPNRVAIENDATQVHELLKDYAKPKETERERDEKDRASMEHRLLLSKQLLGPVAGQLANKRLIIVADGRLQYVPFAALPEPGSRSPLVAKHEIVNLPSVTVLGQLRRELTGRPPAPKSIVVFADPVYLLEDDRFPKQSTTRGQLKSSPKKPGTKQSDPKKAPALPAPREQPELKNLRQRLKASGNEAKQITRLFRPGTYTKILGFDASRAKLDSTDLSQYRILHFATHGLLKTESPELSGIVLSLYDKKGQTQDGFLRAHELYNLKLGADLVVLSACQTALGKSVQGEGMIGLARGFMYAGAPRLVVSLWLVDDSSTAELMTRFYQGMKRQNLTAAAALRAAQASMAREKKWSAPYKWAGFVLQGEWR